MVAGDIHGFLLSSYTAFVVEKKLFEGEINLSFRAGLVFLRGKTTLVPHLAIRSNCGRLSFCVFCLLEAKRHSHSLMKEAESTHAQKATPVPTKARHAARPQHTFFFFFFFFSLATWAALCCRTSSVRLATYSSVCCKR